MFEYGWLIDKLHRLAYVNVHIEIACVSRHITTKQIYHINVNSWNGQARLISISLSFTKACMQSLKVLAGIILFNVQTLAVRGCVDMTSLDHISRADGPVDVDTRLTELSHAFILLLHRHHEEKR